LKIERLKNLTSFGIEILKRYPKSEIAKINLSLTLKCNHQCVTCGIWKIEDKNEIDKMDIDKILWKNDLLWVNLTGGEPTLAKDFPYILKRCLEKVKLVTMTTNGQLPDRIIESVNSALKQTKDSMLIVQVSLFGNKEAHDKMSGIYGSYRKAIGTIYGLNALRFKDRFSVGIQHVISTHNKDQHLYIQKLAEELKLNTTFTLEQQNGYLNNTNNNIELITMPKLDTSHSPVSILNNLIQSKGKVKQGCVAGEYSCWITPDKNAYPCFFSVPNHRTYNLKDKEYYIRKLFFKDDKNWIKECPGCLNNCESYQTLIFRPLRLLL
jgi:MoaA/NifB/PqqE/SkfB family radical SAM enzyme